jgi:hypothetical protein
MPITPLRPVKRLSQAEFQEIAYEVMGHVFEIHNDFGRLLDEEIYKQELKNPLPEVPLSFPSQFRTKRSQQTTISTHWSQKARYSSSRPRKPLPTGIAVNFTTTCSCSICRTVSS